MPTANLKRGGAAIWGAGGLVPDGHDPMWLGAQAWNAPGEGRLLIASDNNPRGNVMPLRWFEGGTCGTLTREVTPLTHG